MAERRWVRTWGRLQLLGLLGLTLAEPLAGTAAGTAASAAASAAADAPTTKFASAGDEWFVVELGGERVGWAVEETRSATLDGRFARRSRSETRLRVARRNGGRVETLTSGALVDWFEDEAGNTLGIEAVMDQSGAEVRTTGRLRAEGAGRVLELTTRTAEGERRDRVPWDDRVLSPGAGERLIAELVARGKGEAALRTFSPEAGNALLDVRVRILGPAALPDGGPGLAVDQEMVGMGLTSHELWTREGRMVRQELGPMTLTTASREVALAPFVDSLRAFGSLTSRLLDADEDLRRSRRATFTLLPRAGQGDLRLAELFVIDARQTVVGQGPEARLVVDVDRPRPSPAPTSAFLAPSSLLESDDPELAALARRIAAEVRADEVPATSSSAPSNEVPATSRDEAVARALERWVHDHVHFTGSGVGLASAKQTLRTRDGDCTENATLLAALLRAAGIASRLVVGLVAIADSPNAAHNWEATLYPHAWVEAWTSEGWLALDAAIYGPFVDAGHLALGTSSGADVGALLDLALPVVRGLGRFDLRRED